MSNWSRHSNVCVISSFPFAIRGFDAISSWKRLKLVKLKIIITLIRKIYWIVIQAGAWCSVPLRDTYHSAKIWSWCHSVILEEPCLYKAWSYAATTVLAALCAPIRCAEQCGAIAPLSSCGCVDAYAYASTLPGTRRLRRLTSPRMHARSQRIYRDTV